MEEEKIANVEEETRANMEEKKKVEMKKEYKEDKEKEQRMNIGEKEKMNVEEETLTRESQAETEETNESSARDSNEQESSLEPQSKSENARPYQARRQEYWLKKYGVNANEARIIAQSKKKPATWKKQFIIGLKSIEKMKRILSRSEKESLGLQEPKLPKQSANDLEGINESFVKIGVCSQLFPTVVFSTFQLKVIQKSIFDKMLGGKRKSFKPQFTNSSVMSGYLVFTCSGMATANWLREVVKQMAEWGGIDVKTLEQEELPSKTVLIGYFHKSKQDSGDKMLSYIDAQNEDLNVKGWKLLRRAPRKKNDAIELTVMIDPLSSEQLKKRNYKINYKFEQVTLLPTHKKRKFFGNFTKNVPNPTEFEAGSASNLPHQQLANSQGFDGHVISEESKCFPISVSNEEWPLTSNIGSNQWENLPTKSHNNRPAGRSFASWKEHTNVETKSWEGETLDSLVNSNPVHQFENVMTQGQWTNTWNENPHFETGNTRMHGRISGNSAASDYQETMRSTLESENRNSGKKWPGSGDGIKEGYQIPETSDNWALSSVRPPQRPHCQDARDNWVPSRASPPYRRQSADTKDNWDSRVSSPSRFQIREAKDTWSPRPSPPHRSQSPEARGSWAFRVSPPRYASKKTDWFPSRDSPPHRSLSQNERINRATSRVSPAPRSPTREKRHDWAPSYASPVHESRDEKDNWSSRPLSREARYDWTPSRASPPRRSLIGDERDGWPPSKFSPKSQSREAKPEWIAPRASPPHRFINRDERDNWSPRLSPPPRSLSREASPDWIPSRVSPMHRSRSRDDRDNWSPRRSPRRNWVPSRPSPHRRSRSRDSWSHSRLSPPEKYPRKAREMCASFEEPIRRSRSRESREDWSPTGNDNRLHRPSRNQPEDSPFFRESRPPFRSDDRETTHQGPGTSRGGSYRGFRGRGPRRGRFPFRGVSSGRGFPRESKPMEWFPSNSSRPIRGTSRGPRGGGRYY